MTSFEELEKLQEKLRATADVPETPKPPPKKVISYLSLNDLIAKKPRTIEVRTGLSKSEFEYVLNLLKGDDEEIKRGPKLLDLDVRLLITLQWLQLNQTYKHIGYSLDINESRVQTSISSIWDKLRNVLVRDLVPSSPFNYTPRRLFPTHSNALGAIDATLIEITAPTNRNDNKAYYSGKHGCHGGKVQVLVAPDGICIHMSDVICGSRHDYFLYKESGLEKILTKGRS